MTIEDNESGTPKSPDVPVSPEMASRLYDELTPLLGAKGLNALGYLSSLKKQGGSEQIINMIIDEVGMENSGLKTWMKQFLEKNLGARTLLRESFKDQRQLELHEEDMKRLGEITSRLAAIRAVRDKRSEYAQNPPPSATSSQPPSPPSFPPPRLPPRPRHDGYRKKIEERAELAKNPPPPQTPSSFVPPPPPPPGSSSPKPIVSPVSRLDGESNAWKKEYIDEIQKLIDRSQAKMDTPKGKVKAGVSRIMHQYLHVGKNALFANQGAKFEGLKNLQVAIQNMTINDPQELKTAIQTALDADKDAHSRFSQRGEVDKKLKDLLARVEQSSPPRNGI